METKILSIFGELIKNGDLSDSSLMILIIIVMCCGFKYIIRPMRQKIDLIPSQSYFKDTFDELKNDFNIHELSHEIEKKFLKLLEILNDIESLNKEKSKEVDELKRDLDHVKQILNQLHGHLIYNAERRAAYFGNKELK